MIAGCSVDSNFFSCMIHYAPEMLLLTVLGLAGVVLVWMYKGNKGSPR